MRVVLDTSVMVAAIRSDRGASRILLTKALKGELAQLISVPLMVEYEAVMTRPIHLAASGLDIANVGEILDAVAAIAIPVELAFLWRPTLRDANDDMVLETAVNGGATAIATFNQRDFGPAARFGVDIVTPGAAVESMEKST